MSNNSFPYKVFLVSLAVFFFASCKSGFSNEERESLFEGVPNDELVTPYADVTIMENVRSTGLLDQDVVNWKISRFFAIVKKIEFESHYTDWVGAKISTKPIVIYYPYQNKPKFYEFRVIKDGKEIGSITCNASKREGQPVVYVSQMTHKVMAKTARELIRNTDFVKLSSANYPNQFVMQESGVGARNASGEVVSFKDALTCEKLDVEKVFIEEKFDKVLENADEELLNKLEISEEDRSKILAEIRDRRELEAKMWQDIDSVEDKILAMSDEEIESKMHMTAEEFANNIEIKGIEWTEDRGEDRRFLLTDWTDKKDWVISNGEWCGPIALTYFLLGLGKDSGCDSVPTTNNKDKINALYKHVENETGTGALYIAGLNEGLKRITDRKFWVKSIAFHRWQDSHDHLVNEELPLISLRIGKSWNDPAMHHRLIIGDSVDWQKNHYVRWWWFFGWWPERWTQTDYNYWYYMRDNVDSEKNSNAVGGSKIDFWEITGNGYQSQLFLIKRW